MSAQGVLDLFDTGLTEEAQPEVRSFTTAGRVRLVRYSPPARGQQHRRCDERCINAVSDDCSCKCGGANHGIGHIDALDRAADVLAHFGVEL